MINEGEDFFQFYFLTKPLPNMSSIKEEKVHQKESKTSHYIVSFSLVRIIMFDFFSLGL